MGGRVASALAHAVERWRWACAQELQKEQLQMEQLQRGRQADAFEAELVAKLVAERGVLASAQQEVAVARGEEKAASLRTAAMAARLAAASQEGAAATSLRARVESMTQM